ncbi:hypothetical protein KIN34_14080 [Cellulomonas sp. DKR-3]|uniref:Uncharacterized protein n=1 Tax=Cellulomonas fulva TaxID=2835530 RepID=A0ABS5U1Y9_9CELL|nr:hypothetical protein [Cellulomonas fulva]MBT0995414.1 hypothetical protein [Cellulomonas fulva]
MADEIRAGNVIHVIEGVGDACTSAGRCAVGEYLSHFEGRSPDFIDARTGAGIVIDRTGSSPVVIVQKPWQISGYHADEKYIRRQVARGAWD